MVSYRCIDVSAKFEGTYLKHRHQVAKRKGNLTSECRQWSMIWEIMLTIGPLGFDTLSSVTPPETLTFKNPRWETKIEIQVNSPKIVTMLTLFSAE